MTTPDLLAELDQRIAAAPPEERAGLVVQLAARLATLGAGFAASGNEHEVAEVWITPQQAAKIASIEVRTLYDWAANKPWASRKTKRCLRIDERSFRRWLSARTR